MANHHAIDKETDMYTLYAHAGWGSALTEAQLAMTSERQVLPLFKHPAGDWVDGRWQNRCGPKKRHIHENRMHRPGRWNRYD